ncbi:hypothetical protein [Commensalibacter sp. A3DC]|uniref:hypothetical protein n=1 Tax=Commensalibacter sp. A3DC TaxID=3093920 RepID=UPI0039B60A4E
MMDINAINHAKTMYVSLHGLCDAISVVGGIFVIVLSATIMMISIISIDSPEYLKKNCFKCIKRFSIAVIILSILLISSLIIQSYYKSQLVVSGMSIEQISKLVGK